MLNKKFSETKFIRPCLDACTFIYVYFASKGEKFKKHIINGLLKIKVGLSQESKETKEMLAIYYKFTQGNSSIREMKLANEQFRDLVRALGIGIFAVLPFAPITIPFIVKLGKKFGIDILPSSFRD